MRVMRRSCEMNPPPESNEASQEEKRRRWKRDAAKLDAEEKDHCESIFGPMEGAKKRPVRETLTGIFIRQSDEC